MSSELAQMLRVRSHIDYSLEKTFSFIRKLSCVKKLSRV